MNTKDRIISSALWAAYGDALGFISEFADSSGLKKRIGQSSVSSLVEWRRRIGGMYGPESTLLAGCYSDDTQLRLATGRAIRGDGTFDVEVFAKIELTVWPCYALGGGRGTKAASANLQRQDINWFSNFFSSKQSEFTKCGGNGAAMRIQPHVWASTNRKIPKNYILDVIRNSICTHGHFRGILGSVFHALCLAAALDRGTEPGPNVWKEVIGIFKIISNVMRNDMFIGKFWVPTWENKCGKTIEFAIDEISKECISDIDAICRTNDTDLPTLYAKAINNIGGNKRETAGSGTKTAILASYLAWLYRSESPVDTIRTAANAFGSDTDTIATMAGAIAGACKGSIPKETVLDAAYITSEAERLSRISEGFIENEFAYPNILSWAPPKSQLDAVGRVENDIAIAGLGRVKPLAEIPPSSSTDSLWQWYTLPFGQTILAKRRQELRTLPPGNLPTQGYRPGQSKHAPGGSNATHNRTDAKAKPLSLLDVEAQRQERGNPDLLKDPDGQSTLHLPDSDIQDNELDIDIMTQRAIASQFDAHVIGKDIIQLSKLTRGVEKVIGYAAIIAKAIASRQRQKGTPNLGVDTHPQPSKK